MICPCIKCPDQGCGAYHDVCPKYIAYKSIKDKERQYRQQKNNNQYGPLKKQKPLSNSLIRHRN